MERRLTRALLIVFALVVALAAVLLQGAVSTEAQLRQAQKEEKVKAKAKASAKAERNAYQQPAKTVGGQLVLEEDIVAELAFSSKESKKVTLCFTNRTDRPIQIAKQGYYMDDIGSAGSRQARSKGGEVPAGTTRTFTFHMKKAAQHGDNSVLVFFFYHNTLWHMGKTGSAYGTEYYTTHDN